MDAFIKRFDSRSVFPPFDCRSEGPPLLPTHQFMGRNRMCDSESPARGVNCFKEASKIGMTAKILTKSESLCKLPLYAGFRSLCVGKGTT